MSCLRRPLSHSPSELILTTKLLPPSYIIKLRSQIYDPSHAIPSMSLLVFSSQISGLLHSRRLRFLSSILTPRPNPPHHTTQITNPPNKMIPHTGTILTSPTSNHNNTMLLHVMSNSWNIRRNDSSRTQPDFCGFALAGIGLFGFCDADF